MELPGCEAMPQTTRTGAPPNPSEAKCSAVLPRDSGCTRLSFYGTAVPHATLREAARLPYPLKNYDTTD